MTHKKPTKEINHGADAVFRGVRAFLTRLEAKYRNDGFHLAANAMIDAKLELRAYRHRATKRSGGIGRK
jgi:hypothetical protein